jgi:hypothetical protein
LIFQAYVVNETYKNMQNVMTKRMICSVVCHIRHRIRHRIRHCIRYCSTTWGFLSQKRWPTMLNG